MNKEKKTLQFQVKDMGVRADDDGQEFGQIEAYGAVFNNIDAGNDMILPGSFKRTIAGSQKRAKAREKKYLFPMLWSHDTAELIGGWSDVDEDNFGLKCKGEIALATQRGREYYALAKAGMSDQFSIIYDVPQGGSKYNKSGVRELSEIRLYTIDPVVLAMNDETLLVGVKSADGESPQKKDFNTLYMATQSADALEDWGDLVNTLTQAMMQAFSIGDDPQADLNMALQQFGEAVSKWSEACMQCGLPAYINDRYAYNPGDVVPYVPGNLRVGGYDYMSRQNDMDRKAGRAISAANRSHIDEHVANLHGMAGKATKSMQDAMKHMKSLHAAADDFASRMQGAESEPQDDDTEETDEEQPTDENKPTKSGTPYSRTRTTQQRPPVSTDVEQMDIPASLIEELQLLRPVKSLKV